MFLSKAEIEARVIQAIQLSTNTAEAIERIQIIINNCFNISFTAQELFNLYQYHA